MSLNLSVDVSEVSVMIATSVLWSLTNFCNSMVLFLTLVAFHNVNFNDFLLTFYASLFSNSFTIRIVAFILSKFVHLV